MSKSGDPPLILIVDDDPDIRDALAVILEDNGCRCAVAANGKRALEYLLATPVRPDLILLDLMMPELNGWQFRAAQIAEATLADIPVLVLTAVGDTGQRAPATADQILRKPLRLAGLFTAIRRLLPRWEPG